MEQFANLASSTVNSSYSPGASVIVLASGTGFPTSGTFSITVVDKTTGLPKLIFRVTSVSGANFTGSAESSDVACNVGDKVYGTMISTKAMQQVQADCVGPWVPLAQPSQLSGWSWANQASCTLDETSVGSLIINPTSEASINIHARVRTAPATPYHIIGQFGATWSDNVTNQMHGLCFSDGTKFMIFGRYQDNSQNWVQLYCDTSTHYGGSSPISNNQIQIAGPYIFLRIGDDGTNRTYDISHDGVYWYNLGSEANNTDFTATQVGFFVNSGKAGVRCYSFRITG